MARANNQSALSFNLLLLISFLLIGIGFQGARGELQCKEVHGVEDGETCSTIAQGINMDLSEFESFNPNINCDAIFVGQWVCVNGSSN
ncbi:hypothetical protein HS088_TW22G00702 [Tripterygium wilfordii]|uniref:LysM domain-containing protein n=1 Tax=Tripterygium wilfordii TaxID=458696 RepID=A0A7J7BZT0_TRIWF|nr:hypothetical protein HS088_TW22G00702 [Tripterygium wilfordii]